MQYIECKQTVASRYVNSFIFVWSFAVLLSIINPTNLLITEKIAGQNAKKTIDISCKV